MPPVWRTEKVDSSHQIASLAMGSLPIIRSAYRSTVAVTGPGEPQSVAVSPPHEARVAGLNFHKGPGTETAIYDVCLDSW